MGKRKFPSAAHAKRHRELDESWQKLLNKYPARSTVAKAAPVVRSINLNPAGPIRASPGPVRSLNSGVDPIPVKKQTQRYEGDMLKRDQAARDEYERKKLRIAPAYNKGGLQFLSEGEMTALQRGELRRRS